MGTGNLKAAGRLYSARRNKAPAHAVVFVSLSEGPCCRLEDVRVVGISGVDGDLPVGMANEVPAWAHAHLGQQRVRTVHRFVAAIVVLGVAVLQLHRI